MRKLAALILALVPLYSFSQTYTTTTTGGDWSVGGTWIGGSSPANWQNYTAVVNGNINVDTDNIRGFTAMSLNNGKTFTRGTSGNSTHLTFQNIPITVNSGTITVYGDLSLENTSLLITAGNLDVRGTLTIKDGSSITFNSTGSIKAANLTSSGGGGNLTMNSGTLTVTNAITINSSSTFTLASGVTSTASSMTIADNSSATLNNNGTMTINGTVSMAGNLNNSGTLQINGNLAQTSSSNSITTNSGNLNVTGNVDLPGSAKLKINPGGQTLIFGNTTVYSNENLIVGTSVAPPPYADLAIKGNLDAQTSGDLTVKQNGRFAVFGNMTADGGDSRFIVENDGQAYVHGNITFTGGSSQITNNNSLSPYGLYVKGTVTNSGGGATTTTNKADRPTMESTNVPFTNWVNSMFGLLPVKLLYFRTGDVDKKSISLFWATSEEKNLDRFILEKSTDGKTFVQVFAKKGAGDSKTARYYTFVDEEPFQGRSYYRLKTIDLDAFTETFNIISVSFFGEPKINIYPNPVKGQTINVYVNFAPLEDDVIKIMDNAGLEVYSGPLNTQLTIDRNLSPGIYHLHLVSEGKRYASKFIVE